MKNQHLFVRMGFAIAGLRHAISHEKSIRFQLFAALAVFVLLGILQPAIYWWAIILVIVAMVIAAEMFNTAIEVMCDFVEPEHSEKIRIIKDVAAGGVLITSIASLIVAGLLIADLFLT